MTHTPGRPAVPLVSAERVVVEAIGWLDEVGISAFSVRGLADRLGVTARSIRHHVGSRGDLLTAVADHVLADVQLPPEDVGWSDRLRLLASSLRTTLLRHPGAVPVVLNVMGGAGSSAGLAQVVIDAMRDAAPDTTTAVHAHNAYFGFLIGFVAAEAGALNTGLHSLANSALEDELGLVRESLGRQYASVSAADVAFTSALDVVLAGVAASFDAHRATDRDTDREQAWS